MFQVRADFSLKVLRRFQREYTDQYSDLESIGEICALDDHILERTAHVNSAILSERHRVNSRVIKLIRKNRTADLAGYYILYPIRGECEGLIEEGRIVKSSQITAGHICQVGADAASLYLSMVYGNERGARAFLIYLLYRDIRAIIKESRSLRYIFVRPVTSAGLRTVEKHRFDRLRQDSGIFRRIVTPERLPDEIAEP